MPRKAPTKRGRRTGRPLAVGAIEDFDLVISPLGYFNKREITNMDVRALVKGSFNCFINDADKVATRLGYTVDGADSTINNGIDSSKDWSSKFGLKTLRSYQGATANTGKLQFRSYTYGDTTSILWRDILASLTITTFAYSTWWSSTENQDFLLIADGTSTLRMWSGGMGFVAAQGAGGTTLVLLGGGTWKQSGFLSSLAGRAITIAGTSYTYTGGENTTTLTGVSALPAITVGTFVSQTVVSNVSIVGLPATYTFDVITVQGNHVWLGDTQSREAYISKSTSYIDYAYTSPVRLPTDGWKMTFDDCVVAFVEDDDVMYVIAGTSDNYKVTKQLTADGTGELFKTQKLRGGTGQAAISQGGVISVKNGTIFLSNENTVDWLTNVQNINTPQALPLSDPVKLDFDSYDLTGATGQYYLNQLYIAIPAENLVRIYDFDKALWQPPWTMPIASFSVIANDIYGHSNFSNETYKLNTGLTDNDVEIEFTMAFSYRQFGKRGVYKNFDWYYNELYMSASTVVSCTHRYEYQGAETIIVKQISGTDTDLMFGPTFDASLGKNPLGSQPLGSTVSEVTDLNKYRCIHEMIATDFFEHQIIFSSEGGQFEMLAHGPNTRMSTNVPRSITR